MIRPCPKPEPREKRAPKGLRRSPDALRARAAGRAKAATEAAAVLRFPKPTRAPKAKPEPRKRSRLQRHLPKHLTASGAADRRAYLDWVKTRPCEARCIAKTPCRGPVDPHHAGRRPGTGLLCPAEQAFAACRHHHQVIERSPWELGLRKRAGRWVWCDVRIEVTQAAARAAGHGELLDRLLAATAAKAARLGHGYRYARAA